MQSTPQLMLMMLSGSVRGAKHLQLMLMMLARLGQRDNWIAVALHGAWAVRGCKAHHS